MTGPACEHGAQSAAEPALRVRNASHGRETSVSGRGGFESVELRRDRKSTTGTSVKAKQACTYSDTRPSPHGQTISTSEEREVRIPHLTSVVESQLPIPPVRSDRR